MLSRAFAKPKKSPRDNENSSGSVSNPDYEDFIFGFTEDLPIVSCSSSSKRVMDDDGQECDDQSHQMTLREILRGSVGVMGESPLGLTEKAVLLQGRICAVKRFRMASVQRKEFGRRIQRIAEISGVCECLVPVTGYLYAKRIKFVVCDYYPMGSLADLLTGAREYGQTALDWNQRLKIIFSTAQAIAFIHSQNPPRDKNLHLNVHGNIKTSNVLVKMDFTACLSDYGFVQIAEPDRVSDTNWPQNPPPGIPYQETLSQASDVYNFGIIVLDILGRSRVASQVRKRGESGKEEGSGSPPTDSGDDEFLEFFVEGKERRQALRALEVGLACTNSAPEARPAMDCVMERLWEVKRDI